MYKETLISWHCVKFLALSAFSVRWSVFDRKTTTSSRRESERGGKGEGGGGYLGFYNRNTKRTPWRARTQKYQFSSLLFFPTVLSLFFFPRTSAFTILSLSAVALPVPTYGRVTLKWFIHLIKFAFETRAKYARSRPYPAASQNRTPPPLSRRRTWRRVRTLPFLLSLFICLGISRWIVIVVDTCFNPFWKLFFNINKWKRKLIVTFV